MTVRHPGADGPISAAVMRGFGAALAVLGGIAFVGHLWHETANGLASEHGLAFGDDFVNFWSAARLTLLGRTMEVYDVEALHQFQRMVLGGDIHLYHYNYPPSAILLTLPLGALPYLIGLAAWLLGGWFLFALAARHAWPSRPALRDVILFTFAVPAVLLNSMAGQNGTWMAAILGGGLMLMERRPMLGGALLGLLAIKPHLGLLVPLALVCGRHWHALGAFLLAAVAISVASLAIFGVEPWLAYAARASLARQWDLEQGAGVWHWMISVFAGLRQLGTSVPVAYAAQGVSAVAAAAAVAMCWWRPSPAPLRHAVLVLCTLLATPYVLLYDHVVAALVPLWLWPWLGGRSMLRMALLLAAPAFGLILATLFGLGVGWLFIVPVLAFAIATVRTTAAPSPA